MLNKVIIEGRITKDPEFKVTPSGLSVVKIAIANNRTIKQQEKTTFVDIAFFGKTADFINQYLKKGDRAVIGGRLEKSSWQDKDGKTHTRLDVVGDEIGCIPKNARPVEPTNQQTKPGKPNLEPEPEYNDIDYMGDYEGSDLPF